MRHPVPVPDVVTHRAVFSACEKDQERQQPLILWRAWQHQDLVPDVTTHSTVISAARGPAGLTLAGCGDADPVERSS